ncbi:diguanylate cyclase [Pseudoalteromonas sp. MMG013]|uniref:diguanylate cyclase domain-containing protein n=1 Tax=Pseudoalteromonas sp. MMG013 TaxID=2822687 RepID=UPI001B358E1E|nr:diguanylate cyclase [Pseudoalteromonas sp. MMG013]
MNSRTIFKQWTNKYSITTSVLVFLVFSAISLFISTGRVGIDIWYANMAFGLLLSLQSYHHWIKHCLIIFSINLLLYVLVDKISMAAIITMLSNIIEAVLIALLVKQAMLKKVNGHNVLEFTFLLYKVVVIPSVLGALFFACLEVNLGNQPWFSAFSTKLIATVLGAVSIFPLGYYIYYTKNQGQTQYEHKSILLIGLTTVINVVALKYLPFPYAYTSLALVLSALFMPFSMVSINILVNSIVSLYFVSIGLITITKGEHAETLFLLPMLITYITPALLSAALTSYRHTYAKLTSAHATIKRMYDYTPVAMLSIDSKGIVNAVSEQWLDLLGYTREDVLGRRAIDFLTPNSREYAINYVLPEFFKLGKVENIRYQVQHKKGMSIDVELTSVMEPKSLHLGKYFNSLAVIKDVTTEITLTKKLAQDRELLETTLMSIGDGVIATDVHGLTRFVNPIAESLLSVRRGEMLKKPAENYIHLIDRHNSTRLPCPIRQVLDSRKKYTFEQDAILVSKTGVQYSIQDTTTPIVSSKGELQGVVMVFQDVTELVASNDRMAYLAQHDSLTGLPNRTLALDRLHQACSKHTRVPQAFAVAFVDVDNFKQINDTHGHDTGDVILQNIGKKLNTILRSSDTAARIGGDEFLLLLHDVVDRQAISQVYEKLNTAISEPIIVNKKAISVSVSIGVCLFPDDGTAPELLLKNSDEAMYHSKSQGRNRLSFYSQSVDIKTFNYMSLSDFISDPSINFNEIFYITPLIKAVDHSIQGVIIGYDFSSVLPQCESADVFTLAQKQRVFSELSRKWFLGLNKTLSGIRGETLKDITIRVDDRHLVSSEFYLAIEQTLESLNIAVEKIVLSFKESVFFHDNKITISAINKLKNLNIRLDVREFGVNSISLDFLNIVPLDSVTIGAGLTSQMETEQHNEVLAYTLIKLAKSVNLKCTAVTVATSYQATLLEAMGCDYLLGSYFYKPLPIEQINKLIDKPCNIMLVSSDY